MRLNRISVSALAAATVAALALLVTLAASADKPFGLQSLTGTYHFAAVQIRQGSLPGDPPMYCDEYGRLAFDGAGSAALVTDSGYGVCSNGENPFPGAVTFSYTVSASGSVVLTDESDDTTTHCQIVDKGALLLCDGTGGIGGNRRAGQLAFTATAGKL